MLRRLHLNGPFGRSVLKVAAGTGIAQIIGIAVAPLLTRLYTPEDFGVYAAASTIIALVGVVSSLRYVTAIPLPPDGSTAASLIVLSGLLALATTGLMAVVLALFGGSIADLLGATALASVLWIVVLDELGGALYEIVNRWATRERAFGEIAKTRVTQGIGMAISQIGFAVVSTGPAGLLLGDAIGRAAGTWRLTRVMWSTMRPDFQTVSWATIRRSAIRYRRFPTYSLPGSLLDAMGLQAPTIFLLLLYGPETAGLFLLAQRVSGLPVRLVGPPYAQVYAGHLPRQSIIDRSGIRVLFTRSITHLAVAGLAPTALLAVAGLTVFPIIFGSSWSEAGVYLTLLSPMWYLLFIWHPISATLDLLERQRLGVLGEVVGLALVTGAAVMAWVADVGSTWAVLLLGSATSLGILALLAITWIEVKKASSGTLDGHQEA